MRPGDEKPTEGERFLRRPVADRGRARPRVPGERDVGDRRDAADRRGPRARRRSRSATWRPSSRPGWSPRRSGSSPRTCTATSSTTPSTRISAEIEQRCIRMLADLFHAPGRDDRRRTQGSSEAIMLGALSLKWKWRERREAAGKSTDRPNLVFGGDVHVVWEKFCRYFDVEPRIVPLQQDKYTIGPEDVEPHLDENTIGVAAVLGTTFTGHCDDIVGINDLLVDLKRRQGPRRPAARRRRQRRLRVAVPLPRLEVGLPARAGPLDQRLRATSSGSSTRASAGWSSARSPTSPRTWSSTRTTSARPTRRSR